METGDVSWDPGNLLLLLDLPIRDGNWLTGGLAKLSARLLDLPIRDGNCDFSASSDDTLILLDLPIRDGNSVRRMATEAGRRAF